MSADDRLLQLVERERWQRLQDHFARVLGIPLRTVGANRELLVNPSWPAGLDAERAVTLLRIGDELEQVLPEPRSHGPVSVTTPVGATYAAVPIHAGTDGAIAYFVAGPLIVGPREDEHAFRQRMEAQGADGAALWSLLLSLKLYTHAATRALLSLLEDVGTSLAQYAAQARQLPAVAAPRVDQAVTAFYTDRILQALLEASLAATHAEGGSVMMLDEAGEALQIKAAQGLSGTIIAGTRQPRGEGLAGLALAERRILLVDRDTPEARLRQRCGRQEIASSLIAPLAPAGDEEPIGVLNLRSCTAGRRFTEEHMELLKRLLELASAGLGGLRLTQAPQSGAG